jgi:hypothetical protein
MFTSDSEALAATIIRVMRMLMETVSTSGMLENFYQTTWHNNQEDSQFHARCHENLKSHSVPIVVTVCSNNGRFPLLQQYDPEMTLGCPGCPVFRKNMTDRHQWANKVFLTDART